MALKFFFALASLVFIAPALAQNQGQIVPSGHFTSGHTFRAQNSTGTVAVDGGGAAGATKSGQGYLTEIGITNTGTPFCINDALINAPGGYHQFCLGASALGGGLISYNAIGGAAALGLNFNINGTTFSFPGPGNGNVIGPAINATAGHVAVWNGGLTLGGDSTAILSLDVTPNETAARSSPGHNVSFKDNPTQDPCTGGFGRCSDFNNVQSLINSTLGTTVVNTNAFAAYILNQTPNIAGPDSGNSSLFYGVNAAVVNNAHSWALNPGINDAPGLTGVIIQNEFDVSVFSAGTKAYGLVFVGDSTAQPLDSAAVAVAPLSAQNIGLVKWQRGFWTQHGSTTNALEIGANTTGGASIGGQNMLFDYFDASASPNSIVMGAQGTGKMAISSISVGAPTGLDLFNNTSGNASTASALSMNTLNGGGVIQELELGGGFAVLEISNSGAGGIQLTPGAGGQQFFGSSVWTANGSVATALSSVGPTGSHTTVQEWFTVKDTAGTTRYIPAF